MLVELNEPTFFNVLALISYAINMLFHAIAFGTDNWCHFKLHGRRVKIGIWNGCWYNQSRDTWDCMDAIFDNKDIFKSGIRWHIGTRIWMTRSLVLLFIMEFVLISYTCIRRFQRYRKRLVEIGFWLTFSIVLMMFIVLLIIGTETTFLDDAQPSICFALEILCLTLSICSWVLIFLDSRRIKIKNLNINRKITRENNEISTNDDTSFITEWSTVNSRSTQELRLSLVDSVEKSSTRSLTAGSISCISQFTASTDFVSYYQEPIRRVSFSSLESTV